MAYIFFPLQFGKKARTHSNPSQLKQQPTFATSAASPESSGSVDTNGFDSTNSALLLFHEVMRWDRVAALLEFR